ncbi:MAG: hypothetical protein ACYDCQ_05845 [Dehalococcoidia bacterium]
MGLRYNPRRAELTDDRLRAELRALEDRHDMTTAQFLARYNRGELGDCPDFIDWAGLAAVANEAGVYAHKVRA